MNSNSPSSSPSPKRQKILNNQQNAFLSIVEQNQIPKPPISSSSSPLSISTPPSIPIDSNIVVRDVFISEESSSMPFDFAFLDSCSDRILIYSKPSSSTPTITTFDLENWNIENEKPLLFSSSTEDLNVKINSFVFDPMNSNTLYALISQQQKQDVVENSIRKIELETGNTTIIFHGVWMRGDPTSISISPNGQDLYICENKKHFIFNVTLAKQENSLKVKILCGLANYAATIDGDNNSSRFDRPQSITLDSFSSCFSPFFAQNSWSLFVSQNSGHIRRIEINRNCFGEELCLVSTIASDLNGPRGLCVGQNNTIFVCETGENRILAFHEIETELNSNSSSRQRKYERKIGIDSTTNFSSSNASKFLSNPHSIQFDSTTGALFVKDDNSIRMMKLFEKMDLSLFQSSFTRQTEIWCCSCQQSIRPASLIQHKKCRIEQECKFCLRFLSFSTFQFHQCSIMKSEIVSKHTISNHLIKLIPFLTNLSEEEINFRSETLRKPFISQCELISTPPMTIPTTQINNPPTPILTPTEPSTPIQAASIISQSETTTQIDQPSTPILTSSTTTTQPQTTPPQPIPTQTPLPIPFPFNQLATNEIVRVNQCSIRSSRGLKMTLSDFYQHRSFSGDPLYLFHCTVPESIQRQIPLPHQFSMNENWIVSANMDIDFQLMIGYFGTWTGLHIDKSPFSAVISVQKGSKLAFLFPPESEELIRQHFSKKWMGFRIGNQLEEKTMSKIRKCNGEVFLIKENEALYVPSGWIHGVENLGEETVAINYYFANETNLNQIVKTLIRNQTKQTTELVQKLIQYAVKFHFTLVSPFLKRWSQFLPLEFKNNEN